MLILESWPRPWVLSFEAKKLHLSLASRVLASVSWGLEPQDLSRPEPRDLSRPGGQVPELKGSTVQRNGKTYNRNSVAIQVFHFFYLSIYFFTKYTSWNTKLFWST